MEGEGKVFLPWNFLLLIPRPKNIWSGILMTKKLAFERCTAFSFVVGRLTKKLRNENQMKWKSKRERDNSDFRSSATLFMNWRFRNLASNVSVEKKISTQRIYYKLVLCFSSFSVINTSPIVLRKKLVGKPENSATIFILLINLISRGIRY